MLFCFFFNLLHLQETYNKTGETHLPHIRTEMSGPWNSVAHVRVFFLTFPVYEELLLLDSGLHKPAFGFSRRNKPEKSHMFQFQGECNDANCEGDRPEKTKERPRLLNVFHDIPVSICHVVLLNQIKSINSKQVSLMGRFPSVLKRSSGNRTVNLCLLNSLL